MAFFLLGRTEDGTLSLLSDASFSTRQDALAELSRITGRSSFDRWNEDVLLFDLDTATPVLLVRPAVAPQPEPEIETQSLSQAETAGVVEAETAGVADAETAGVAEAEPVVAVWAEPLIEPVGDPAIADMIVEEAAGEMPAYAETAQSPAPVEPDQSEAAPAPEETVSLRDALARTAVHMESTGVVATRSVGPVESTDQLLEAPAPDSEPVVSHEVAAWPWDVAPAEAEPAAAPPSYVEIAYVTTPLEEPALDDGSILRGSIDDDMFAAARPVILGAYPEAPSAALDESAVPEPEFAADTVTEPMGTADVSSAMPLTDSESTIDLSDFELVPPAELEPAVSAQLPDRDLGTEADPSDQAANDISDFILDLDAVAIVASADEEAPATIFEPVVSAQPEYTCVDCIYVETCPNKDQRLPADCGTFQWR